MTEQIQKLQQERDDATQRLAAIRDENERLNRNSAELLKLRGEVGLLRQAQSELARMREQNQRMLNATSVSLTPSTTNTNTSQLFMREYNVNEAGFLENLNHQVKPPMRKALVIN